MKRIPVSLLGELGKVVRLHEVQGQMVAHWL